MKITVKTSTVAQILGMSESTVLYYMSIEKLPIGIYDKNDKKKADVHIFRGQLADYLKISQEQLEELIDEIEGENDGRSFLEEAVS